MVVAKALGENEGPWGVQVCQGRVLITKNVGVPDRYGPRRFQNKLVVVTEHEDEPDLSPHLQSAWE